MILGAAAGGVIYSGGKSAMNSEPEAGSERVGVAVGVIGLGKLSHFLQKENLTIVNYAKNAFKQCLQILNEDRGMLKKV